MVHKFIVKHGENEGNNKENMLFTFPFASIAKEEEKKTMIEFPQLSKTRKGLP